MKVTVRSAIAAAVGFLFVYMLGSFVAADFNIMHWKPFGRFVVAVLGCASMVSGAAAARGPHQS